MRLIVRADATTAMGTGHLMRCMALGQAWRDAGGEVELLTRCENDALTGRLAKEGFRVKLLGTQTDTDALRSAQSDGPAVLVLDGYHFDAEYQARARDCFRPLVAIDDLADLPMYCADLILNQNIYATQLNYPHQEHTRLLLGCEWALLRREFVRWTSWQRVFPEVGRRVLVTLGGSDPDNVTERVVEALAESQYGDDLEMTIVAGASNPYLPRLRTAALKLRNTQLCTNVTDMPALMAWADAAVIAGGSTCWETAFMQLPSLIVVLASNQVRVAEGLACAGGAINLGWHRDVTVGEIAVAIDTLLHGQEMRRSIGKTGRKLVNGQGAQSAVAAIRELL